MVDDNNHNSSLVSEEDFFDGCSIGGGMSGGVHPDDVHEFIIDCENYNDEEND